MVKSSYHTFLTLKKVFCWIYQKIIFLIQIFDSKLAKMLILTFSTRINCRNNKMYFLYWLLSFLSLQIIQNPFVSHLDWIECAIEPVSECVSDIARLANSGVRIGSALQLGIKISVQYFSNELFWYFNFRMVSNFWC